MGLGTDNETCKTEFVEAMRPIAGDNVEVAEVQANLGALGQAVYRIATVHAETVSDETTDATFWQWVADVNAWLSALADWQQDVAQAFANWAPTQPAEQALKTNLVAAPDPGSPPTLTPTNSRGRIE